MCTRSSPGGPTGSARCGSAGGLSGYPAAGPRAAHDVVENSHASTSLSYADGFAKALPAAAAQPTGHVVAVDRRRRADRRHGLGGAEQHRRGAGPAAWSSSSTTTGAPTRRRSAAWRTTSRRCAPRAGYERFLEWGRGGPRAHPGGRRADLRDAARREEGPQGHRRAAGHVRGPRPEVRRPGRRPRRGGRRARAAPGQELRRPGDRARDHREGPRLRAGRARRGRPVPRRRRASTRRPACRSAAAGRSWTSVFADELVAHRPTSAPTSSAITAAMLGPVGPRAVRRGVSRAGVFDVGIAEQHAVDLAPPGMAFGGLHPVVAVYATFLNRAFDQVLMDVALHRPASRSCSTAPGVTGDDGASHNGMWDLSLLQVVPGPAPRRAARRRHAARRAARGGRRRRRARPSCASPRAPSPPDVPAIDACRRRRRAAPRCRVPRTCSSSPSARWRGLALEVAERLRPRASASPSSTRAGSPGRRRRSSTWRAPPARRDRRGQRPGRRRRVAARAGAARRRACPRRCATSASRSASSTTASRVRCWPRSASPRRTSPVPWSRRRPA